MVDTQPTNASGILGGLSAGVKNWWSGSVELDASTQTNLSDLINDFKTGTITFNDAKKALEGMSDIFTQDQINRGTQYFDTLSKGSKQAKADVDDLATSMVGMSGKDALGGLASNLKNIFANFAISAGISLAIAGVTKLIGYVANYKKNLIEAGIAAAESWATGNDALNDQISTYEELKRKLESGTLNSAEEYEISAQILEIQKQITSQYGEQAEGISLVNGNLNEQLLILQKIASEEAKKDLVKNAKEYGAITKEMTQERTYTLASSDMLSDISEEAYNALYDYMSGKGLVSQIMDTGEVVFKFNGDATNAENALTDVILKVEELQKTYANDDVTVKALERYKQNAVEQLAINTKIMDQNADTYNTILQQRMLAAGVGEGSVYDVYNKYAEAVNNFNQALAYGDTQDISNAEYEFTKLNSTVQELLKVGSNHLFTNMFQDITNSLDTASIRARDFEEVIESIYQGDYFTGTKSQASSLLNTATQFGNVDLLNRPLIDTADLIAAGFEEEAGNIATTFTQTFNNKDATIAMNFTPILPDGSVMEKGEFEKYCEEVVDGVHSDNLQLKIGSTFSGEDTIAMAIEEAQLIHEIQDSYYLTDNIRKNNQFRDMADDIANTAIELKHLDLNATNVIEAFSSADNFEGKEQILELGKAWGITTESSVYDIKTFANALTELNIVSSSSVNAFDIANEALSGYKLYVTDATEATNALKTALSESVSGTGITADSLKALRDVYGDDVAGILEETANGYHLNSKGLRELTKAQEENTKTEYLSSLSEQYEQLRVIEEEIASQSMLGNDISGLIVSRNGILDNISALEELQRQYEASTSAYAKFQEALSGPKERDMYEQIIGQKDTVEDLIEDGWKNDPLVRSYTDLLSSKDLSTAAVSDVMAEWNRLNTETFSTGFTVFDFFTTDSEGNSTTEGVYNFFDTVVAELGKGYAWVEEVIDENTGEPKKVLNFDFGEGKDKEIADKFGMDVEAVQAILRAAAEGTFNINLDEPVASIEELKTSAESAQIALTNMDQYSFGGVNLNASSHEGILESIETVQRYIEEVNESDLEIDAKTDRLEYANDVLEFLVENLKEAGYSDIEIPIDSTQLDLMIENAKAKLDQFKTDGEVDFSIEGADVAVANFEALIRAKQTLEQPAFMEIDVSTLEGDAYTAMTAITQLEIAIQNLNFLRTQQEAGIPVDTSELQLAEQEVLNLSQNIIDLNNQDVLIAAGANSEAFINSLTTAVESQSVEPDVVLDPSDIQTQLDAMSPSITAKLAPNTSENDEQVNITAVVMGQEEVEELIGYLDLVTDRNSDVTAAVDMNDYWNVVSLTTQLDKVVSKDITINVTVTGDSLDAIAGVNGTAHVNGSAYSSGTTITRRGSAFAKGNWGLKHNVSSALVGELGPEIVVRNGKWMTVGENGAEFVGGLRKGDIIFNHKQSEELLEKGYVTSGGGRGRAFASGTAFSNGYGDYDNPWSGPASSSSSSSNYSPNSSSNQAAKDAEETAEKLDWIEVLLQRIQRDIDNLDKTASATFKSWTERNTALSKEISKVNEEIKYQLEGYERYLQEAESIGLDPEYAEKVRAGLIDIESIEDEGLREQISEYQDWYEKALACSDAVQDLQQDLADLSRQRFDNVMQEYEDQLSVIEHNVTMIEGMIDQTEAKGYIVGASYYEALKEEQNSIISDLQSQRNDLMETLNEEVVAGRITLHSEEWYSMMQEIWGVDEAIQEAECSIIDLDNSLRQLEWNAFDKGQEMISRLTDESEFYLDLMSDEKMFDSETGKITEHGLTTYGLHTLNYNTLMAQADDYAKEMAKINAQLANDPNNQTLLDRKEELIDLQRDAIKGAEDEKQAILDLTSEGFDNFLNIMDGVIDKHKEWLSLTKDLYDYEKNVAEQVKDLASLEKQRAALEGDTSESTRAQIQKLDVQIEDARKNLEEIQYDKYIQDQEQMLDSMREDTENYLNSRLDNSDLLLSEILTASNTNAETIKTTLESEADAVGTTLSENMSTIWDTEGSGFGSVVSEYCKGFGSQLTTTNSILDKIRLAVESMYSDANKEGQEKADDLKNKTSNDLKDHTPATPAPPTVSQPETTPETNTQTTPTSVSIGGKINAGTARIYANSSGTGGGRQYFADDPIYTVIGEQNGYYRVRWHKLSSGSTGWFKKSDVKAYKKGGLLDETGLFWGDGTKTAPEVVLDAKDSRNFVELRDELRERNSSNYVPISNIGSIQADQIKTFQSMLSGTSFVQDVMDNIKATVADSMNNNRVIHNQEVNVEKFVGEINMYGMNDPKEFTSQLENALKNNSIVKRIIQTNTLGMAMGKNSLSGYIY